MWWLEAYEILKELEYGATRRLICECLGQGEWFTCNNCATYNYLDNAAMAEQLWAEKEKLT